VAVEDERVALVYLKRSFKGPKIAAQALYPLEKEQPLDAKLNSASKRIREFLVQNRIFGSDLYLGLPEGLTILRYVELPLAVKENLGETLEYEMEKHVPFSADDVCFDYQIVKENKETEKLTVLLAIVKRTVLQPFLELAGSTGGGIAGIEPGATAIANIFAGNHAPFAESGYVLLFLEDGHFEINFIEDNLLYYSRSLRFEGNNDHLLGLVRRELGRLKEKLELKENPMPTAVLGPEEIFEGLRPLEEMEGAGLRQLSVAGIRASQPALIPAYGLALRGIHEVPMDLNLLPGEYRKKAGKVGRYAMLSLLGLGLLAALAWGGGHIAQKKMHLKRLDAQITDLGTKIAGMEETRGRIEELQSRIDYVAGLRSRQIPVLEILKELTQSVPETAWVQSLSYEEGELQIEGYGESASELITLLEASRLFEEVTFLSRITKTRGGGERYRIGLKIRSAE
jgi:general secretion pathway protein L